MFSEDVVGLVEEMGFEKGAIQVLWYWYWYFQPALNCPRLMDVERR